MIAGERLKQVGETSQNLELLASILFEDCQMWNERRVSSSPVLRSIFKVNEPSTVQDTPKIHINIRLPILVCELNQAANS